MRLCSQFEDSTATLVAEEADQIGQAAGGARRRGGGGHCAVSVRPPSRTRRLRWRRASAAANIPLCSKGCTGFRGRVCRGALPGFASRSGTAVQGSTTQLRALQLDPGCQPRKPNGAVTRRGSSFLCCAIGKAFWANQKVNDVKGRPLSLLFSQLKRDEVERF